MTTLTKPVRRVVQVSKVPHGFRNRLIFTLYPGGVVSVREIRRNESVEFDLASLYASAVVRRALGMKPATRRAKSR